MTELIDRHSRVLWQLCHPFTFIRQSWLVWRLNRRTQGHGIKEIHIASRADMACLMKMKDETGYPLFWPYYDKHYGVRYTFLGKPVYWPEEQ